MIMNKKINIIKKENSEKNCLLAFITINSSQTSHLKC